MYTVVVELPPVVGDESCTVINGKLLGSVEDTLISSAVNPVTPSSLNIMVKTTESRLVRPLWDTSSVCSVVVGRILSRLRTNVELASLGRPARSVAAPDGMVTSTWPFAAVGVSVNV